MGSGRGSVGAGGRVCMCVMRAGRHVMPVCGRIRCLPMWARAHPVALASLQKEESAKRKKEPHLLAGGMGRWGHVGTWVRARVPIVPPSRFVRAALDVRGRVCWGTQTCAPMHTCVVSLSHCVRVGGCL